MLMDSYALDYFVDEYIYEIIDKEAPLIGEFKQLYSMLKSFNPPDEMPDEEKIAQPEWKAIMAHAAKVLELSRNSPLAAYMPKK
jgi:hypothetical protein